MSFSGTYLSDRNKLPATDPTASALTLAPNAPPLYDAAGKLNWPGGFSNPMRFLLRNFHISTDNLVGNAVLSYEFIKGLRLKSSVGYTKIQMNEKQLYPKASFNPASGITSGNSYFGSSSAITWIAEPQLEYEKNLGGGKLTVLAGMTFQEDKKQANLLNATGFLDDALIDNLSNATTITKVSVSSDDNYYRQYKYTAFFSRIHYNWKSKYIINLTGRRDGSSRFGPASQFANFGAIGAGWIFSNENWLSKWPVLSFGKLRASYGTTGNDQIPDYGYMSTYTSTTYPYNGGVGLYPTRLFNADYQWEVNKKLEAALELGLWKDRLFLSVTWYRNRSSNQLVGFALPGITGFSSIQANSPATVENRGFEWEVSGSPLKSGNFDWSASLNLTVPRNKLVRYPDLENSSNRFFYSLGKPLSSVLAYQYTGVDPKTGLYTFNDIDGNGTLSLATDGRFTKALSQDYYGGLQNSFRYKDVQLEFLFQYVKQWGRNYLFNNPYAPGMTGNQPVYVLQRWRADGDISGIQKFTQDFGSSAYTAYINAISNSDLTISDASYIRLKNVSLSYQAPETWREKLRIQGLKLFLLGQNLWTYTKYLGMDPETQNMSSLPPLKLYSAGIQMIF